MFWSSFLKWCHSIQPTSHLKLHELQLLSTSQVSSHRFAQHRSCDLVRLTSSWNTTASKNVRQRECRLRQALASTIWKLLRLLANDEIVCKPLMLARAVVKYSHFVRPRKRDDSYYATTNIMLANIWIIISRPIKNSSNAHTHTPVCLWFVLVRHICF